MTLHVRSKCVVAASDLPDCSRGSAGCTPISRWHPEPGTCHHLPLLLGLRVGRRGGVLRRGPRLTGLTPAPRLAVASLCAL